MHTQKSKYKLLESGYFQIENYNQAKPFASFLPGVAGLHGLPLWAFYVNRGQCLSSFGSLDKDHALLEFFPANKTYQNVSALGFRTFIKNKTDNTLYEPFQSNQPSARQSMQISPHDLKIVEKNQEKGLETTVHYYTLPNAPFAALVRKVTIKNISKEKQSLSLLDGLPVVIPFGMNNWLLKHMARTAEAWVQVLDAHAGKVPFFNLKVEINDSPEVTTIDEGHFMVSFLENQSQSNICQTVVDPTAIFGSFTDFSFPQLFAENDSFQIPNSFAIYNKMPCAFSFAEFELAPNQSATLYSTMGRIRNISLLQDQIQSLTQSKTFEAKENENKKIIDDLTHFIDTQSNSPVFDAYTKQSFLDNVLRGGFPINLSKNKEKPFVVHAFWRKHGDLERDYNHFQLLPTYYAQGNANYRDVNQNRRMDPWFNPAAGSVNILTFLNLIQLDGYNPLVLKSVKFHLQPNKELQKELEKVLSEKEIKSLLKYLNKPVTPGELLMWLEDQKIKPSISSEDFLSLLVEHSLRVQEIDPSEGFWIDHWHYNLDLIENYLRLFPEKIAELLIEKNNFTFYDSPLSVRPRNEKHVLHNEQVRQYQAILHDKEKEALLGKRLQDPSKVRTKNGKGEVYHTNLVVKLFTLLFNKIATLDPSGIGVEMEADRPNWYDALNGLPGLLGSSVSETFEIKRLIAFLKETFKKTNLEKETKFSFPVELVEFYKEIEKNLSLEDPLQYWNHVSKAKELYREKIHYGINGKEKDLTVSNLLQFLEKASAKIDQAIQKAWSEKDQAYFSYFSHEVIDYQEVKGKTNANGQACVVAKQFKAHPLPLFLEGIVHALRTEKDLNKAKALYLAVQKTDLYDQKLGMYKVNASLESESVEIGRTRIFSPGWLENGSVFMHMEFKYMLELLRSGLVEEFYKDLKKTLPAFMDPAIYGRSLLENSTFIAPTNNPDPATHGTGFVARLSGTNAEWVHIWNLITVGLNPFTLNEKGELVFQPQPLLPSWLFKEKEKRFTFCFLGSIEFTYLNPTMKNSFGNEAPTIQKWILTDEKGETSEFNSSSLTGETAQKIRSGFFKKIQAELG